MSWKDLAVCHGQDTNIFFDVYEDNEHVRSAIDTKCMSCPVNRRCFAEGVSGEEWGVWGGVYLEEGEISREYNSHKTPDDWQRVWQSLTMEV